MNWTIIAGLSAAAHVLAWVATAVMARSLAREHPEHRAAIAVSTLGVVTVTIALVLGIPPESIPTSWITILTESGSEALIQQLEALGVHSGAHHYGLLQAMNPVAWPSIRHAVWLNLWSTAIGAVFFFGAAWWILRTPVGALVAALLYLCNPLLLNSAFSELSGGLLNTYFWMGVVACVWLGRTERVRSPLGSLALGLLVLVTGLAAWTRIATSIIGLAALLAVGARHFLGDGPLRDLTRRTVARTLGSNLRGRSRVRWFVLLLLATASIQVVGFLMGHIGWLIRGLNPLNPTIMALPVFLLATVPVGVAVLAPVGMIVQLRRSWVWMMLPVAFVVLFRIWFAASHLTFYEMVRYMSAGIPMVWLAALVGWAPVRARFAQYGWKGWALASLLLLPLWTFVPGMYHPILIETNHQRAFRFLLNATEDAPECAFMSRVSVESFGAQRGQPWRWMGFNHPDHTAWSAPDGLPVAEMLNQWSGAPECILFYRGMDCNLHGQDPCEKLVEGLPVFREAVLRSGQYNAADERGLNLTDATVGVYVLRGQPVGAHP
jgi:hypothetical protein